jgi:hypothetical protein
MSHRKLKKLALNLLQSDALDYALEELGRLPARQIVNPLFGLLYHGDPIIRWRAVTAMGAVVASLAAEHPESARVVMRRFLWNLNDESGGIGWGSPEAMGEIMARSRLMAEEYACMLVSYADPCGNYLEHPQLQYGVIWALGRLGRARPGLIRTAADLLPAWLRSPDPNHRGLAAWAARPFKSQALAADLGKLRGDTMAVRIYSDEQLADWSVGALAEAALEAMATPS